MVSPDRIPTQSEPFVSRLAYQGGSLHFQALQEMSEDTHVSKLVCLIGELDETFHKNLEVRAVTDLLVGNTVNIAEPIDGQSDTFRITLVTGEELIAKVSISYPEMQLA